jgi:histidine ammonia-lyase
MGTDAALIAAKVIENAYVVLAIELVTLSQAAAMRDKTRLTKPNQDLVTKTQAVLLPVINDRPLNPELETLRASIMHDPSLDIAW